MTATARIVAGLIAASAVGAAARADDPPWGTISASIAVQSDYIYRGISQNNREITPEGGIDWDGPQRFYAGVWAAKIDWTGHNDPSIELDMFAGKHFDLGGTDLNVEAYYYSYPDANFPGATASYYETIAQLSRDFGPFTLTITGANSPHWGETGGVGWYTEGTAHYQVNGWLSVSANLGHQWVDTAPSDYSHWDLGATATWRSWSLDVRYFGNDIGAAQCAFWMSAGKACRQTAAVTLSYSVGNLFP